MKVLDASAFLCYLQDEPGAELVAAALRSACLMSAVNFAEVLRKLADQQHAPSDSYRLFHDNFVVGKIIDVIPFTHLDAKFAAELYIDTKKFGLSSADRACLSLARQKKCQVLTTDKIWANLKLGIDIKLVR